MALLSFRGISTPSLTAQGEQRRSSYFNIRRGDPLKSSDRLLGAIATHYVVSPFYPGDGNAPEAPPMASVSSVVASTSAMTDGNVTVDAITDAEYRAPAIDMRHPVMVAPTRGAISPGVVTFKSS
jgi:hypothetical protein